MADGRLVAAVERKSLSDLSSSVLNGNLRYQLIELSALPRAAVVVEDRYSEIFGLTFARPAVVADGIATTPQRLSSPTTDGHERALSLVFARPVAQQKPRAEVGDAAQRYMQRESTRPNCISRSICASPPSSTVLE